MKLCKYLTFNLSLRVDTFEGKLYPDVAALSLINSVDISKTLEALTFHTFPCLKCPTLQLKYLMCLILKNL